MNGESNTTAIIIVLAVLALFLVGAVFFIRFLIRRISSIFGSFRVRDKRAQEGRNPKTGEPAPIPARRVVTFRSSQVLKVRIAEGRADTGNET